MKKSDEKTLGKRICNASIRSIVTLLITVLVVAITVVIAWWELFYSSEPTDKSFLSQTLIPLWATWIGTVLAFHFGRENFKAAEDSMQKTIDKLTENEKLAVIPVKAVMIPFKEIELNEVEKCGAKSLIEMLKEERFEQYSRYAFINKDRIVQHFFHRSNLTQYITDKVIADVVHPENTTFDKFVEEIKTATSINKEWYINPVFIAIDSNLLEAKRKMLSVSGNKDVFVTLNGDRNEPVLGLITDKDILRNLEM